NILYDSNHQRRPAKPLIQHSKLGQVENIKKESKKIYYNAKHSNDNGLSKAFVGCAITTLVSLKPILTKKMEISDEEYDKLTKMSEKELFELDSYLIMVRVCANKVIA
ncbi:6323_t:CDS:2, partial [Dentiscutata heterogama]